MNQEDRRNVSSLRRLWAFVVVGFIILLILIFWLWGRVGMKGVNPNQISIRESNGMVQWQYLDSGNWQNIVSLAELRGGGECIDGWRKG